MRKLLLLAPFVFGLAHASDGKVITPMLLKELTDLPGKEALMLTVDYAPGSEDAVHRHDAHAFLYVLQGSVVMQLQGSEPVTLKAGQVFYEGPKDLHLVGRNASKTEPAKFVVVLIKNRGVEAVLPPY